jgi:hypothetical protein
MVDGVISIVAVAVAGTWTTILAWIIGFALMGATEALNEAGRKAQACRGKEHLALDSLNLACGMQNGPVDLCNDLVAGSLLGE